MSTNKDNLIEQLAQLGMSVDAGRVYIELMQGGKVSPLSLSRKLNIPRTKVYRILSKLQNMELVEEQKRKYGSRFMPVNPSKLLELVNRREKELLLVKASINSTVFALNSLFNKNARSEGPVVSNHQGKEAAQFLLDVLPTAKHNLWIVGSQVFGRKSLGNSAILTVFKKLKQNPGLKIWQITNPIDDSHEEVISKLLPNIKICLLRKDLFETDFDIFFFNNKVLFVFDNKGELVIEQITGGLQFELFKRFFEALWKMQNT